jgi:hypothetical protein
LATLFIGGMLHIQLVAQRTTPAPPQEGNSNAALQGQGILAQGNALGNESPQQTSRPVRAREGTEDDENLALTGRQIDERVVSLDDNAPPSQGDSPAESPPQKEKKVDDDPPSPLAIPRTDETEEERDARREKAFAEEREKALAIIAEERKFIPLVDDPDKLIPVHPVECIWVTPDRKSVVLTGRVALREGFLELLACRAGSKEHESILVVRVLPARIHEALLVVNAKEGKPMVVEPEFIPASGDKININLRWKDEADKQQECPAQDWVWDMSVSKEDAKKPMSTHWVFAGSKMITDDEGKNHYLANETGDLFGLSNFVGSILDIPIQSTAVNADLLFGCFTDRIPPKDTLVTIILTPEK